ncbi:MAG: efflux RND transporter periplasmic adaptor subunit [Cyclobacteriaceae bacterium]|jgi:RND family efflux transporter MFP subunit|nr:efflux RND transporter periplasmic adaptor subunit [Flammeovirgaceae bacterium]
MKNSIKIIITVALVGIMAGALALQLRHSQQAKLKEAIDAQAPINITVESLNIIPQQISKIFSIQGITQPFQEVVVASEATGKISQLFIKQGDVVKAGAPLCRVDIKLKEIELKSATVQLEKAKRDYEKFVALQAASNISATEVESAHVQMMQWSYNVQSIEQQIKESTVCAPFQGMIIEKAVDVGGYLQVGTPVATLVNVQKLKALVWLNEGSVSNVRINDDVRIQLDAMPNVPIHGKIKFINPKASDAGKFQVMIEFDNTMHARAGMSLRAFFNDQKTSDVLMIPKTALVLNSEIPAVFVIENNKARLQPIALGNSRLDQIEVIKGLSVNTTIVSKGVENVIEGQIVNIANSKH